MSDQMLVLSFGQNAYLKLLVHVLIHKLFQLVVLYLLQLLKSGPLKNHVGEVIKSCCPD